MTRNKFIYRKINKMMENNELSEILVRQYGYDLYNFAVSLAIILSDFPIFGFWNIWKIKNTEIPGISSVKKESKRLSDIRRRFLKLTESLKEHLREFPQWHEIKKESIDESLRQLILNKEFSNLQNEDEITRKLYKLEDTLKIIDEEISYLQNNMWKPFRKGKGKPVEPNFIIHAFWSLVMRKKENADMKNVENLVNWFDNKLNNTTYGSVLKYEFEGPSLYRFITENREKLEEDRGYFFPKGKLKEPHLPRNLRVEFASSSPEISAYDSRCKEIQSPLVFFPDKTTYP